jgi:very-short-patch-repair endonuclease
MKTTPLTYVRAKRMRREPTEAENRLWGGLRGSRLSGLKFHRQVPIGPYIVDFLNREFKTVIEVDGDTHGGDDALLRDEQRTNYLKAQGLQVYRVTNYEIFRNVDDVLQGIYQVVTERGGKS